MPKNGFTKHIPVYSTCIASGISGILLDFLRSKLRIYMHPNE
jgi:hypothetical protein